MTAGQVRGKGSNFIGFRAAVRALFDEEAWSRVLAEAPPRVVELMTGAELKAGEWYPVADYRALHEAASRALPGEQDLARRLGKEAMRSDLSGVYRVFTYFLSPHNLVARAAPIFATYWEDSEVEVERLGRTHVRVTVRGARGFDAAIWADISGGIEACLEESGAADVVARFLRRDDAEGFALLDICWRAD